MSAAAAAANLARIPQQQGKSNGNCIHVNIWELYRQLDQTFICRSTINHIECSYFSRLRLKWLLQASYHRTYEYVVGLFTLSVCLSVGVCLCVTDHSIYLNKNRRESGSECRIWTQFYKRFFIHNLCYESLICYNYLGLVFVVLYTVSGRSLGSKASALFSTVFYETRKIWN